MFPLLSFTFRANWEQGHKNNTSCRLLVVLCSLETWDSWMCNFSIVDRVQKRLCSPKVHLWATQQTQLRLSTCNDSAWCLFCLCYTIRRRHFCCEYLLALSGCVWYTQVLTVPTEYCFRVRKNAWIQRNLYFSEKKSENLITFGCTFQVVNEVIKHFIHYCCVEVFNSVMEELVSHPSRFRIYEEMMTLAQLRFKIRIIKFVEDIVSFNFCCLDRKDLLDVLMLT